MKANNYTTKLAQSASALGAGLLGFGLGSKWGSIVTTYAVVIIVAGAIFHVVWMYVMQLNNQSRNTEITAGALWISAWICLVAVLVIIIYLLLSNKK
jgi:NADH:ubiquinone oxidoreductase subunit 6 (subunit J)